MSYLMKFFHCARLIFNVFVLLELCCCFVLREYRELKRVKLGYKYC